LVGTKLDQQSRRAPTLTPGATAPPSARQMVVQTPRGNGVMRHRSLCLTTPAPQAPASHDVGATRRLPLRCRRYSTHVRMFVQWPSPRQLARRNVRFTRRTAAAAGCPATHPVAPGGRPPRHLEAAQAADSSRHGTQAARGRWPHAPRRVAAPAYLTDRPSNRSRDMGRSYAHAREPSDPQRRQDLNSSVHCACPLWMHIPATSPPSNCRYRGSSDRCMIVGRLPDIAAVAKVPATRIT